MPSPAVLAISTVPPSCRAKPWTWLRPSPEARAEPLVVKNGSKTCSSCSASIPTPEIGDLDAHEVAGDLGIRQGAAADPDVAGLDLDGAAGRHGVAGVDPQIDDRGLELVRIDLDRPEVFRDRQLDIDRIAQERPVEERGDRIEMLRDVDVLHLQLALPREGEELGQERRRLVARDERRDELAAERGLVLHVLGDRIDVGADHHQLVVEIVRDAAGEPADRLHLLGLAQAALGLVAHRRLLAQLMRRLVDPALELAVEVSLERLRLLEVLHVDGGRQPMGLALGADRDLDRHRGDLVPPIGAVVAAQAHLDGVFAPLLRGGRTALQNEGPVGLVHDRDPVRAVREGRHARKFGGAPVLVERVAGMAEHPHEGRQAFREGAVAVLALVRLPAAAAQRVGEAIERVADGLGLREGRRPGGAGPSAASATARRSRCPGRSQGAVRAGAGPPPRARPSGRRRRGRAPSGRRRIAAAASAREAASNRRLSRALCAGTDRRRIERGLVGRSVAARVMPHSGGPSHGARRRSNRFVARGIFFRMATLREFNAKGGPDVGAGRRGRVAGLGRGGRDRRRRRRAGGRSGAPDRCAPAQMTLEEKVGQLNLMSHGPPLRWDDIARGQDRGADQLQQRCRDRPRAGGLRANRGSKIPPLFGLDVLHGFRTQFPVPLAEAAAFNPRLSRLAAEWAAREAAHIGVQWTYAPMADLSRDVRWGRIVEGFGEDPHLGVGSDGGPGRGLPRRRPATGVKHFAGYGARRRRARLRHHPDPDGRAARHLPAAVPGGGRAPGR